MAAGQPEQRLSPKAFPGPHKDSSSSYRAAGGGIPIKVITIHHPRLQEDCKVLPPRQLGMHTQTLRDSLGNAENTATKEAL